MNYLAHAYLSFHEPEILVGNMISDFVKGRKQYEYPTNIQKGIALHRAIDNFTDSHLTTLEAKKLMKPAVGLYAGAFVDIIYDHFLALDNKQLKKNEVAAFAQSVYKTLYDYKPYLPEKFTQMLSYMSAQDWLGNYGFEEGIRKSFHGLTRRASYLENSEEAWNVFLKNYSLFQEHYENFFHSLKNFAWNQFQQLLL